MFRAMGASRLLLADDQVVGGSNSRIVGSLRSVGERIFSSKDSGAGGVSLNGGGSSFTSFFCSCCSSAFVVSFGDRIGLEVTALFA